MNQQWMCGKSGLNSVDSAVVEHVHNSIRGLEVVLVKLNETNKKLRIFFDCTVLSYTVTRIRGTSAYGDENEILQKNEYSEVIGSKYIDHLNMQSGGYSESYDSRHFIIFSQNITIDIIATREPKILYIAMNLEGKTLLYKEMTIPYIVRIIPTARIILYWPKIADFLGGNSLYIALDNNAMIDTATMKAIEEELKKSDVPLDCLLVDMHAISVVERDNVLKHCVVWKK